MVLSRIQTRLWLKVLAAFGLLTAGCSGGIERPVWYPPPACRDCYQGLGEGEDYQSALNSAKARLCEDISVVVTSDTETTRKQALRDSLSGGDRDIDIGYEEYTQVYDKLNSNCQFEKAVPIREVRLETVGGRVYVLLQLGIGDYARYLATKTVSVDIKVPEGVSAATLSKVAFDTLHNSGYIVVGEGRPSFSAEISLDCTLSEAAGFEGMVSADCSLSYRLTRVADKTVLKEEVIGGIGDRGFDKKKLMKIIEKKASEELEKKLSGKARR